MTMNCDELYWLNRALGDFILKGILCLFAPETFFVYPSPYEPMIEKILVVDNNPLILKLMDNFFLSEGYEVRTAVDGISALHVLETFIPDLMFIDLIMPNIQGDKLCKLIRAMPQFADTYLVIVSAAALEIDIDVNEWGANGCIAKGPFDEMKMHFRQLLVEFSTRTSVSVNDKILVKSAISRRHITEEFISLRKHFNVLFENITDGIVEIHSSGQIVGVNTVACNWFNLAEDRVLAQDFSSMFRPEDQQRVAALLVQGRHAPQEIPPQDPLELNGYFLSMTLVPLVLEESTSTIAIIHDITSLKHEKEAHLKAIADL